MNTAGVQKVSYGLVLTYWLIIMAVLPGCRNDQVIYAQRREIIETVYASGKIVSANEFQLSSLSNGTIIQKLVRDGDSVQKGQLLYIVRYDAAKDRLAAAQDNYQIASGNLSVKSPVLADLELALHSAEVKFSNDSATYFRWKNLWAQDIGTKNNLDNAYSNYMLSKNQVQSARQRYASALNDIKLTHSNARSQLTAAQNDFNQYFIKSDRAGIVYQTLKESGENVFINEPVALLGESNDRIIRMSVDQQDIDKIKTGQQVLLQTDVTGTTIYEARVTRIYPVMNEADQTFRVEAEFIKLPSASFIHSSIEANIIIQKKPGCLVLPADVLINKDSVWVKTGNGKKKVAVQRGITTLENVEIISGITEHTPVLVTGKE